MIKKVIRTNEAPSPVAKYSQAIRIDNLLYIQGFIALDPKTSKLVEGDIKVQAKRVFESIKAVLKAADMSLEDVVKITAFLSNLKDYQGFNEVYNSYFDNESPPVRTSVQAQMPFGALLEVDAIAHKATI